MIIKMNAFNLLVVTTFALLFSSYADAQKLVDRIKSKTEQLSNGELELFEEQPMEFEQYEKSAGKILFSNVDFTRELPESQYITSYTLGDKLSFRAYMVNSPANAMMLQMSESGTYKNKDISAWKSTFARSYAIFNLYLDGELIANTTHVHDFDDDEFSTLPTLTADLKDDNGVYYGEEMYDELIKQSDLLTPGTHKLKLELVPIFRGSTFSDYEYEPIASGEIDLIVPEGDGYLSMENCIPAHLQPRATDKALENEFKSVYMNYQPEGYELVNIWLPTASWNIKRAQYTDRPIEKTRSAVIVSKNAKGELFYDSYSFKRVFDGVEYEPTVIYAYITSNGTVEDPTHQVSAKCAKFILK